MFVHLGGRIHWRGGNSPLRPLKNWESWYNAKRHSFAPLLSCHPFRMLQHFFQWISPYSGYCTVCQCQLMWDWTWESCGLLGFLLLVGGVKYFSGRRVLGFTCGCAYMQFGCSRVNFCEWGVQGKLDVTFYIVGNSSITECNVRRVCGVGGGGDTKSNNGG